MAAGAIVMAANVARQKQREAQAMVTSVPIWQGLAATRGLTFIGTAERPALSGRLLGVGCALSIELDRIGLAHTQASAHPPKQNECTVGVYPNPGGVLGFLKSLLAQDVTVGDPIFDEAFLVRACPASAAASLLGATLRERLMELSGRGFTAFMYESTKVVLQWPGVESDPEVLTVALDAVVEAARWDPGTLPYR